MGDKPVYARIAVRSDGSLILGKNFRGLLNAGHVYEITECLGELVVRDLGISAANESCPHMWNWTANEVVQDGRHLYTNKEYIRLFRSENTNE